MLNTHYTVILLNLEDFRITKILAELDAGWRKQCLVWAKNQFVLGRQDYQ